MIVIDVAIGCGGPVGAFVVVDVRGGGTTIIFAAGNGQEGCTVGFHLCPFFSVIDVGSVGFSCADGRTVPDVGKKDIALDIADSGTATFTVTGCSMSDRTYQALPLGLGKSTPASHVHTPVVVGAADFVSGEVNIVVEVVARQRLVTIIAAGSPAEEVDPISVGVVVAALDIANVSIVAAAVILVLGETPSAVEGLLVGSGVGAHGLVELKVAGGNPNLLGSADGEEAPDTVIGRDRHVKTVEAEGEVAAAIDGDGGTCRALFHNFVAGVLNPDGDVGVGAGGHGDIEVMSVGNVLRDGADEGGGKATAIGIVHLGVLAAVVDIEVTVDIIVSGDFDTADGGAVLLEVESQSTEEVLESKVLVGGGGIHGEVAHEVTVLGHLHGREGYTSGAVGQGSGIDSGDFIAHVGDGISDTTQSGCTRVALLGGSEIETVDKSEDFDGVVPVPLDDVAVESGLGTIAVLYGGSELIVFVVDFVFFLA